MQERKLNELDIVGVLDPARSRESEYHLLARHAIVVTGMDWMGNVFVLHTWARRTDLNELLLEAENVTTLFPTMRCFGVESVAAQIVILDVLSEWLRMNRILVPVVEVRADNRMTKKWRIRMQIQRPATQGKLHLQENQYELKTELFGFPHSRTIDLVDALGYCVGLHFPPEEVNEAEDEWPLSTKTNLEKMIQDGRIPSMPRKPQKMLEVVENPWERFYRPERPGLMPSINDIYPDRGDKY